MRTVPETFLPVSTYHNPFWRRSDEKVEMRKEEV
jgi:hypothetical protein